MHAKKSVTAIVEWTSFRNARFRSTISHTLRAAGAAAAKKVIVTFSDHITCVRGGRIKLILISTSFG